jgi:hypothetical protein
MQIDMRGRGTLGNLQTRKRKKRYIITKLSLYGSRETLITLRVIILQADLELDGLHEFALLFLGCAQEVFDGRPHA